MDRDTDFRDTDEIDSSEHPAGECKTYRGRTYARRPLADRFHEKYIPEPNSGCWLWTKSLAHGTGYGRFSMYERDEMRHVGAHRASWRLHRGAIPDGLFVCHKCDVRACVNPDHLFLGTVQDNTDDMIAKGRRREPSHVTGEAHHKSKLTVASVTYARRAARRGASTHSLARELGVTRSSVQRALVGRTWASVIEPPLASSEIATRACVRKVSVESEDAVRAERAGGASFKTLCGRYGITAPTLVRILRRVEGGAR